MRSTSRAKANEITLCGNNNASQGVSNDRGGESASSNPQSSSSNIECHHYSYSITLSTSHPNHRKPKDSQEGEDGDQVYEPLD